MDINHRDNLIYKLSTINANQIQNIDVAFYLVRKQVEADQLYQTSEIALAPNVKEWVRSNIVKTLQGLKEEDEANATVFLIGDYNHEISPNDKIARFALNQVLLDKKGRLIAALRNTDPEYPEKKTNFQIVKLTYEECDAYFCYYRGARKASSKKKSVLRNANQYVFIDEAIIDIGGNIDFFIVNDFIFIINVRNFEFAFDYRDHINDLRDQNIAQIISMPFFDDDSSNRDMFEESCKRFIYSRSLAQIKPETFTAIEENFQDRCDELSQIKANVPGNRVERERYMAKYGTLWELFEYIDLDNRKIIFTEGASPKVLLHFFADKIVKSFLTEDFKVASAYD